ncbi:MAG TPA: gamma carbonic anhydrase family protein, partial [Gammaproteobacteria bacterium]|nr:gamma carbonic anhydrase family protein [Gammaproteobacteria bacterium]
MIRKFRGVAPSVAASAYVDESAVVIGDVALAEDVSVWPLVVARGDVNTIR